MTHSACTPRRTGLVLATILQRFRVELVPGQAVVPDPTFTLRPKSGVKVLLRAA